MTPTAHPAPDDQYFDDVLHELIEVGMDFVRSVQALARAQPETLPAASAAFDRLSRAVRRTILLARHVRDDAPARKRTAARRRILRDVEDTIEREASTPARAERLRAELLERLESPELDEEIELRPVGDIITDLCRDLGLGGMPELRLWKRRTPADVAALCATAARKTPASLRNDPERVFHPAAAPNSS